MYLSLLVDVPNTIIKIFKKKLFMAIFQIKNKSQNTLDDDRLENDDKIKIISLQCS